MNRERFLVSWDIIMRAKLFIIYMEFKYHLTPCIAVVNVEPPMLLRMASSLLTQAILLPLV